MHLSSGVGTGLCVEGAKEQCELGSQDSQRLSPWPAFLQRRRALALEGKSSLHLSQALGLTSEEVLEGLLHHFLADLRVRDGVE